MKRWFGFMVVLLSPVLAQATAPAGATATAQRFAAVLQDPGHRQMVLQSAQKTPAWERVACAGARFSPIPQIAVYAAVVFDKKGMPVAGAWRESLTATGCGAPMTLNVLTKITAPGTLATGYLLPGTTMGDPILQNTGQAVVVRFLGGIPKGCRDAFVADTEFVGFEGPDAARQTGPWKEIWTVDLCSQPKQVMIHFVPEATTVTIYAEPLAASP